VTAVLARPVHHLRVAAVVALHELRRFQLVVVRGAALSSARLRMFSFRNSHGSISRENDRSYGGSGEAFSSNHRERLP
jgi:hypothetical protein